MAGLTKIKWEVGAKLASKNAFSFYLNCNISVAQHNYILHSNNYITKLKENGMHVNALTLG